MNMIVASGVVAAVLMSAGMTHADDFRALPGGVVIADGQVWPSLRDWHNSEAFSWRGRACGTVPPPAERNVFGGDCDATQTIVTDPYDPDGGSDHQIKLIFHVITMNDGLAISDCTGYVSPAVIQDQVDVLNDDFGGSGSSGADDTQIQFMLEGISYVRSAFWHADSQTARDEFMFVLNVDKARFTNIYLNSGGSGGLLGEATLPFGGTAGQWYDFVMVVFDSLPGNGGAFGAGRTLVHEIGHNYGLYHTFGGSSGGDETTCPSGNCNFNGDLCCDTEREENASNRCTQRDTCGDPDSIENFMNYTYDACMTDFSDEQGIRMRCALETYRPHLIDGSPSNAIGACCSGTSCFIMAQADCLSYGGSYEGHGTSCESVTCSGSNAVGACCNGTNCAVMSESDCTKSAGTYQGDGITCGSVTCSGSGDPTGACCQGENCADDMTSAECVAAEGTWQGEGTTCTSELCSGSSDPVGACCTDGSCTDSTESACTGTWLGDGTACVAGLCGDGDTCDVAVQVYAGSTAFDTTNLMLSNDVPYDDSACSDDEGDLDGPDIWMAWYCIGNGATTVHTCDTDSFDTTLIVYTGTSCLDLVQIACDGDSADGGIGCQEYASMVAFEATQGWHLIRIGGYWDDDYGPGTLTIESEAGSCLGDINQDGAVDRDDLLDLLSAWSLEGGFNADLNSDGSVSVLDLIILLTQWGPC
jgi:hypothetical protein